MNDEATVLRLLRLEMTREEVTSTLGEPDEIGGTSRKYKTPSLFKYGDLELWFDPWKDGCLHTIWNERDEQIIAARQR